MSGHLDIAEIAEHVWFRMGLDSGLRRDAVERCARLVVGLLSESYEDGPELVLDLLKRSHKHRRSVDDASCE